MQSQNVGKIVVRSTNWLGDAVMSIPAVERLRNSFPNTRITLIAPPRAAEVFANSPAVDEVIPYLRRERGIAAFWEMIRRFRREKFDLAILFQNAFEAALLARLGGAKVRIGYETQGRGFLLTHGLVAPLRPTNRHETYGYLDLVATAEKAVLGFQRGALGNDIPQIEAAEPERRDARAMLDGLGLAAGERLLALNAGATNSRSKCWPLKRFAALADRFVDDLNARIILIGAESEHENAELVLAAMAHRKSARNLAGATSIPRLIGLLSLCDLLVTNDTGPAHIGAALGIPTLTLFGPTNEFETAPLGRRSSIIRAEGIECARCMHRDCPIDHRCMTRIEVSTVAERAMSLLAGT